MQGHWNYPARILAGAGRRVELADLCGEFGMQRPLLVTDAFLAGLLVVGQVQADRQTAGLAAKTSRPRWLPASWKLLYPSSAFLAPAMAPV